MFCNIFQWIVSRNVSSKKEFDSLTRLHLRRCSQCREFHQRLLRVEEALRQPPESEIEAGEELEIARRAAAAVRLENENDRKKGLDDADVPLCPNVSGYFRFAVGAATLVAAVGIGYYALLDSSEPRPAEAELPADVAPLGEIESELGRLAFQGSAGESDYSLEKEWRNISNDVQAATDFLISYTEGLAPGRIESP